MADRRKVARREIKKRLAVLLCKFASKVCILRLTCLQDLLIGLFRMRVDVPEERA